MPPIQSFIRILIFLFLVPITLVAQGPLDKKITYSAQDKPLEDILFEISDLAQVSMTFSSDLVAGKRASIQAINERLGSVLNRLLIGTGLEVRLAGSVLVLIPIQIKSRYTVRGYLTDAQTGEPLIGANIYISGRNRGTSSNDYGFFSLTLEEGNWLLFFSYLGYQSAQQVLTLNGDQTLDMELEPSLTLEEVVITAPSESGDIGTGTIGKHHFLVSEQDRQPALGGEVDVLRTSYFLPGVQTGADGFGGISVRGGNSDQNLYLLDGVPVYNATHLLGVYSVFNSSAIHSATLYKGVLPARYGGRASSVMDVRMKEGNLKEPKLEVDLGMTSGKFTLEGPLQGAKSSYIITGRRSFIDLYTRPISRNIREANGIDGELGYFFYDFNAKINVSVSKRDRLFLSFYNGGDNFQNTEQATQQLGQSDTSRLEDARQLLNWGNTIASFRWNHLLGKRLFSNTTITFSRFYYQSQEELDIRLFIDPTVLSADYLFYQYASNNRDLAAKLDFDFSPNPNHFLRFGANYTRHRFQPGAVVFDETVQVDTISAESIELLLEKNPLSSDELDLYVEDEMRLGEKWWLNVGLRINTLKVNEKWYFSPQPRFQLRYWLNPRLDVRLAAGRATQSLHLLSNSGIGLPRDLWVSATERIKPIQSWQYTLGMGWQSPTGWAALVEGYYKSMNNLLGFQEGVLANIDGTNWQNLVIVGSGKAYGVEFSAEKKSGKWTGAASYNLAYADRTFPDENLGKTFPYKLDRRHNFGIALMYAINSKWSASANFTYRSGERTTIPQASYLFNQLNLLYSDFPPQFPFFFEAFDNGTKNSVKLPPYHRLDLNLQYRFNRPRTHHTFGLNIYNAYVRKNPWYYSLVRRPDESGVIRSQYVQYSFIPFLPSLRYRIEFFSNREAVPKIRF
ncbi:MAG: TonB-dependent receptor [Saprospiraceae bacterium]|nr:TonB-dependent receptor [Saprospiraceae bacterium]